jgi:hypothetical protein
LRTFIDLQTAVRLARAVRQKRFSRVNNADRLVRSAFIASGESLYGHIAISQSIAKPRLCCMIFYSNSAAKDAAAS